MGGGNGTMSVTHTIGGFVSIESLESSYRGYINSLSYPDSISVVLADSGRSPASNGSEFCNLGTLFDKRIAHFTVTRNFTNHYDPDHPTGTVDGVNYSGYEYKSDKTYKTHDASFSNNLPMESYPGVNIGKLRKAKIQLFTAPSCSTCCYVKIWLTLWKYEWAGYDDSQICSTPQIISTTEHETTFGPEPCNFQQPILCSERANLRGYKQLTEELELNPYALINSSFEELNLDPDEIIQNGGDPTQNATYIYEISRISFEEGWTPPVFQMSNFNSSGCLPNPGGLFRHGKNAGYGNSDFGALSPAQETQINNWMASTFPDKNYEIGNMTFKPYFRMTDDEVQILEYWFENFVNV